MTYKSVKPQVQHMPEPKIDKHYIDMQISHYFNLLELKIASTKTEILNWFIKIFIGQITGFITIFIALLSVIRG